MTYWYNDAYARAKHKEFQDYVEPFLASQLPGYELSHMGVNRYEKQHEGWPYEEVVITLHLNPIGYVKVVPENRLEEERKLLK